jgi:inhibitor of KinA sporulation pathway (predicted exonuclease)
MNQLLVVDIESTCWESPSAQPRSETSEIIEIGVSLVDTDNLKILANESILVKPQSSKVSKFCTQLTTLTQEMVDGGITYQDACAKLERDYKSYNKTLVSWGDYDRNMFQQCSRYYGCKYPFGKRHFNLKNVFTILHGLDREPGLDAALKHLKMPLEGTHHRGVDDSKNIAKILIHTLSKFRGITL